MTEASDTGRGGSPGPGSGPRGVPSAIALTPILSARYRTQDLDAIRAASPGSRIVTIGFDGEIRSVDLAWYTSGTHPSRKQPTQP